MILQQTRIDIFDGFKTDLIGKFVSESEPITDFEEPSNPTLFLCVGSLCGTIHNRIYKHDPSYM